MSMRIITGATGTAHVTSNDDGSINMGIFGAGNGVLKNGNKITATIIDNNTIRLTDGDIIMQGRVGRIDANTTEDIAISTGAVGENRNDLICVRYSMDTSTGYESMDLVVVEGTSSTSSATDPQYNTGDIRTGASIVDFPLYRVRLTGINIEGVDKLFDEIDTNASQTENINVLQENVETLNSNVDELNDQLNTFSFRVEDGVKQVSTDKGETWENFSKGAEYDLLWENSAPNTSFTGQVVTLNEDLNNFDAIRLDFKSEKSNERITKTIFPIDFTLPTSTWLGISDTNNAGAYWGYRQFKYRENNQIEFSVARRGVNNSAAVNNDYYIPIAIYGIKNLSVFE